MMYLIFKKIKKNKKIKLGSLKDTRSKQAWLPNTYMTESAWEEEYLDLRLKAKFGKTEIQIRRLRDFSSEAHQVLYTISLIFAALARFWLSLLHSEEILKTSVKLYKMLEIVPFAALVLQHVLIIPSGISKP